MAARDDVEAVRLLYTIEPSIMQHIRIAKIRPNGRSSHGYQQPTFEDLHIEAAYQILIPTAHGIA